VGIGAAIRGYSCGHTWVSPKTAKNKKVRFFRKKLRFFAKKLRFAIFGLSKIQRKKWGGAIKGPQDKLTQKQNDYELQL